MFKKKRSKIDEFVYNPQIHKAVLKCSICNGEQVAGFKEKENSTFHEIMFIKSAADLEYFLEKYKLETIAKEY